MRAFAAGRGGGKTHQLFESLKAAGGGVMFVSSRRMVVWCERKFGKQGAHGVQFVSWSDRDRFVERLRARGYAPQRIGLDDLDWFLQEHFGTTVDIVTFNGNRGESVLPEHEEGPWLELDGKLQMPDGIRDAQRGDW